MPLVAIELFDVVAAGAIAACAWGLLQWISSRLSRTPKLQWQRDDFNAAVLSRCPALRSHYRVPALLANRHVETIFAAFFRQVRCLYICYRNHTGMLCAHVQACQHSPPCPNRSESLVFQGRRLTAPNSYSLHSCPAPRA